MCINEFWAHNGHRLEDHLHSVAKMSKTFASRFGAGEWAYMAGLWHDIGKYSKAFQNRLERAADPDAHIETVAKRPDHSTAGSQLAARRLPGSGKLLAYAIAGHHAGLPDGQSNERSCLEARLKKPVPDYSACPETIRKCSPLAKPPIHIRREVRGYQTAFFVRMLFSCLTDADFLDTEKHLDAKRSDWRGDYPPISDLWQRLEDYLSDLETESKDTLINRKRAEVLGACRDAAELPPGLFSLTVPTGGGKTLSSLAFALSHAMRLGLNRIIYVIPFTSIIEQTAAVFRDALGPDTVLEHHSNFDAPEEDHRSRLAAENWDAPVIVTTNVQFFESLFHNRSSHCRKLHRIARSVVIFDEAQLLPMDFLLPCLEALRELTINYGTSVVLCTATQPALHKRPDFPHGIEEIHEIVNDSRELYETLKRVEVKYIGAASDSSVASRMMQSEQVLCIVNTRSHARRLFEAIGRQEGHIHLSALMSPAHRTAKLNEIRQRLKDGKRCRVVSTQLIEAGVDIDFSVVFRAATGIDSIAQAAGRCNREGGSAYGQVYVFMPEEGLPLGEFRQSAQAADPVLARYPEDPLCLKAIDDYFQNLYWRKGPKALDRFRIMERFEEGAPSLNFPFREIASEFKLIREDTRPVVIPWDEALGTITDPFALIRKIEAEPNLIKLHRTLQRVSVAVRQREWRKLERAKSLQCVGPGGIFPILTNPDLYDEHLGLCLEDPYKRAPEGLIT